MGSVRLVTDSTGASPATYAYSAFGSTRTSTGTLANEVRFTGERTDTESGLEFLRARTYDPSAGTFLQRDTWGITATDSQSLDAYVYTANNPVNAVDPSGHCAKIVGDDCVTSAGRTQARSSSGAGQDVDLSGRSKGVTTVSDPTAPPTQTTPKSASAPQGCSLLPWEGNSCESQAIGGIGNLAGQGVSSGGDIVRTVVTGAEDTLDVHTIGGCIGPSGFIGIGLVGIGGSAQLCVMVTGKGQVGVTTSVGAGLGMGIPGAGLNAGPLISSGQYVEDQQRFFNQGSLTMGPCRG